MVRLGVGLFLAILFVISCSSSTYAYSVRGQRWPADAPNAPSDKGVPTTITYSYTNIFNGALTGSDNQPVPDEIIRQSFEEALSLWASVAPLHFVEVEDEYVSGPITDSSYTYTGQYGQLRFGTHLIDGFGNVKGHAYFPSSATCGLCGDVHLDTADRWQVNGTLENPDVMGAAIHELGHSLGLNHSNVSHQLDADPPIFDGANMFPTFRRNPGLGTGVLHADDIAGIQFIYGAGTGSLTTLADVPEPSSYLLLLGGFLAFLAHLRLKKRLVGHNR